jgi:hypothetical protein
MRGGKRRSCELSREAHVPLLSNAESRAARGWPALKLMRFSLELITSGQKLMTSAQKLINFALKLMPSAPKLMSFALELMTSALKLMSFNPAFFLFSAEIPFHHFLHRCSPESATGDSSLVMVTYQGGDDARL